MKHILISTFILLFLLTACNNTTKELPSGQEIPSPEEWCIGDAVYQEEIGACLADDIILEAEAKKAASTAIMLQSTMFHTIQNYERTEEGYTFILQTPERKPYAFNVPFIHTANLDLNEGQMRAAKMVQDYVEGDITITKVMTARCPGCFYIEYDQGQEIKNITINDWNIEEEEITLCKENDRGERICEEQQIACTTIYDPVCAVDENGKLKTYSSRCTACTTGFVERYSEGECEEVKEAPKNTTECEAYHSTATLMDMCRPGEHSVAEIDGEQCCVVNVDPKVMTECPEVLKLKCHYEKACTLQFDPVCGKYENGTSRTFGNGCGACAENSVTSYTKGECEQAVLSQEEVNFIIEEANYCTTKNDCAKLPSRCPYGCQSMVNVDEVDEIMNAINEEDYSCDEACIAVVFPVECVEERCEVQHPNQQN